MADQEVLGLDIGTSRIKFVELGPGRNGPVVLNAGIGLTPRDAISNGVIVEPDALGDAVRQLLDEHGVRLKNVISSVASQSSLVVRPIQVPRMTRQELDETMQWEVERHIPFAASEVVVSFQPMVAPEELPPETQNMDVLLAVAQEDMVNAHVETLFRAGLEPVALDVEPLAACRSLIDIDREVGSYEQTYALLNMGAGTTDLSIIHNGLLTFTRPVPLAGDNITNAIAETLGYEFHEAERVKLERGELYLNGTPALAAPSTPEPPPAPTPEEDEAGPTSTLDLEQEAGAAPAGPGEGEGPSPQVFDLGAETGAPPPLPGEPPSTIMPALHRPGAGTPERQVYEAMLPTLTEMVTEVRRSIEYYVNRFPDSRVDKVLVYGGTARLRQFPEFLANEIGLPVVLGNPFVRLEVDASRVSAEFVSENACFMPIVVGLALRDMLGD